MNIKFKQKSYGYVDSSLNSEICAEIPEGCITTFKRRVNGWYQLDTDVWVYEFYNGERIIVQTPKPKTKSITYKKEILEKYDFDLQRFGWSITKKKSDVQGPNGRFIEEDDISYWMTQKDPATGLNYTRAQAIEILKKDKKYTGTSVYGVAESSLAAIQEFIKNTTGINFGGHHATEYNGMKLQVRSTKGIFGMPYQFMPSVDRRIELNNSPADLGRIYTNKIMARIPLLVMVPGMPEFLQGYSDDEKEGFINYFKDNATSSEIGGLSIDDFVSKPGKYYGLKEDWNQYYQYVNAMCRVAAVDMEVNDKEYFGKELNDFDWQNNINSELQEVWGFQNGAAFYVNSESQISEGFTNSSTASQLASKINEMSDYAREFQFLLGTAKDYDPTGIAKGLNKEFGNDNDAKGQTNVPLAGKGIISSLVDSLTTVMHGGKLIFPEIWADSQFSRDYAIDIKLVSPDCDDLSIYLNIVVPLIHLLGFVMPRSTGPNGFISPFLVRASYKSFFNIDMGLITNMNITKGTEGGWNSHGVPTVVDVNFTIKELYNSMAMSNMIGGTWMLTANTNLQDYIGNLCGININDGDIRRSIKLFLAMQGNRPGDWIQRTTINNMTQWIDDTMYNLWRRL